MTVFNVWFDLGSILTKQFLQGARAWEKGSFAANHLIGKNGKTGEIEDTRVTVGCHEKVHRGLMVEKLICLFRVVEFLCVDSFLIGSSPQSWKTTQ